jgi:hypothetical protein
MTLRSAPLEDAFQELLLTLDDDGGWWARTARWFFVRAYRALKVTMLAALRLPWRRAALTGHLEIHKLFTPCDMRLEQEWRRH